MEYRIVERQCLTRSMFVLQVRRMIFSGEMTWADEGFFDHLEEAKAAANHLHNDGEEVIYHYVPAQQVGEEVAPTTKS